ncbi:Transposase and inactivated derivatives [uncultured Blautia sp.]|nr:Transposase and inactivated derivatives [uncultured Blautia sp.]
MLFLRVIAWCGDEKFSLKKSCFYLYIRRDYCQNQRKYLETFLEDGRIPLSNNYCEANIKPFATARRAWLFADTPPGAFANGVLYTLVESARANDSGANGQPFTNAGNFGFQYCRAFNSGGKDYQSRSSWRNRRSEIYGFCFTGVSSDYEGIK